MADQRPSQMPPPPRTTAGQISQAIAAHQPAPMAAEIIEERVSERRSARMPERPYSMPEPHEKYAIPAHLIPSGMAAQWIPTTIMGAPNPQLRGFYQRQWRPAKAEDFPDFSGYGIDYGPELNASGVLTNVRPDSPVILDGQMLVLRPKELSHRAEVERQQKATGQITTQFDRLRGRSLRDVGPANTRIKRQFAPADDGEAVEEA